MYTETTYTGDMAAGNEMDNGFSISVMDIVVDDIPAWAIVTHAYFMLKIRNIENHTSESSKIGMPTTFNFGDGFSNRFYICKHDDAGNDLLALDLPSDIFSIVSDEITDVITMVGTENISKIVDGNGTYDIHVKNLYAEGGITFNRISTGLKVFFK